MKAIIILAAAFLMSACSSIPGKMGQLYVGMPGNEAQTLLGTPDSVSSPGSDTKIAYYERRIVGFGDERNFFVRYEGERVASYGQVPYAPISPAAAMAVMNYRPVQTYQAPVYQMPISQPVSCLSNNVGGTTYTNCR